MTEHFITLFNSLFLPQGLALQKSMERCIQDYMLWILCVDDRTYDILKILDLQNVCLLKLSEVETNELLALKSGRTVGEYCWTLTPFAPRFVFEADSGVERVTYIDADLWFRKSPKPIFDEFNASKKQVLITDHAYAPEHDQSALSGQFCVQFITFVREGSELVRKWWENRCIEWCFARFEDGKFGDQKYLDEWPDKFGSVVHILQNKEYALAPWNATRFPYGNSIFYHFHGLRIVSEKRLEIGYYSLPKKLIQYVYQPYCDDLRVSVNQLEAVGFSWQPQSSVGLPKRVYRKLAYLHHLSQSPITFGSMKW